MYCVWCNGDHELYDMEVSGLLHQQAAAANKTQRDPFQTLNLYGKQPQGSPLNISQLTNRLDTLLLTLKNCKADSCRSPWKTIFPSGEVTSLQDALKNSYDSFFASQPVVSFDGCVLGYMPELEGPFGPNVYKDAYGQTVDISDEHWI